MDLFEALVRLEAAGWRTGPARPDLADARAGALARLLRKAGSLTPPDGSAPYEFAGVFGRGFADGPPMVRLREAADGVTWLVDEGERFAVWRVLPDGDWQLEARRLSEWLASRLTDPGVPGVEPSRALWDLGLEGEGWGWNLEGLAAPVRFDRGSLPEEHRAGPYGLDGSTLWAGPRVGIVSADAQPAQAPVPVGPPAGSELDELFGDGAGRPRPRTLLIGGLLTSGLALTVLGMACIAAPGGILVLLAWMHVEKDQERVDSGYLPESDRPSVERLRRFTYAGLVMVVGLFALQAILLCSGVYDVLLDNVYLPIWQELVRDVLGATEPPPLDTDPPPVP